MVRIIELGSLCVSCGRSTVNRCDGCFQPLCLPCPMPTSGKKRRFHACSTFWLRPVGT